MELEEIYTYLCVNDPRNPTFKDMWDNDFTEPEEIPKPRQDDCYCDCCFRSQDKLAIEILKLKAEIKQLKKTKTGNDKLFMTEILNDLHKHGYVAGWKGYQMLHDWAKELREDARTDFPASKLRQTFNKRVGKYLW